MLLNKILIKDLIKLEIDFSVNLSGFPFKLDKLYKYLYKLSIFSDIIFFPKLILVNKPTQFKLKFSFDFKCSKI